jgi:hypothetical protein
MCTRNDWRQLVPVQQPMGPRKSTRMCPVETDDLGQRPKSSFLSVTMLLEPFSFVGTKDGTLFKAYTS